MKDTKSNGYCVSVFKNGERTTNQTNITKMWIELINKIEKGKSISIDTK